MENLVNFWKGKKVFITGHTGFKGSWMLALLNLLGARCKGYALPPEQPSIYEIIGGEKLCQSVYADIRDRERLFKELSEFEPEAVIHLAAQPLVIEGYKNPALTFETNVMGTVNLLEAAKKAGSVKALLNVTTDKVYENAERGNLFSEGDRLGGADPYSCSKACSELVTACYRESFFSESPAAATARAGNVVGGGDFAKDRLVPDCVRAALYGGQITLRNPAAIRPWQHVIEPVFFYVLLCQKLLEGGKEFRTAFNIGPDEGNFRTAGDVADIFCKAYGNGLTWFAQGGAYREAGVLKLDNTKAKQMLGFIPVYGIEETIGLVVEWTAAYKNGRDMLSFTESQIKQYLRELENKSFGRT